MRVIVLKGSQNYTLRTEMSHNRDSDSHTLNELNWPNTSIALNFRQYIAICDLQHIPIWYTHQNLKKESDE